jgi:hypothetical protein
MEEKKIEELHSEECTLTDKQKNTLHNLRSMGSIKPQEYIQCDVDGNILSFLEQSFVRCVSEEVFDNNCKNIYTALDRIYIDELPLLIEASDIKQSNKIGKMLEDSVRGIDNLKLAFQETAHTDYLNKTQKIANEMIDALAAYLKAST